MAVRFGVGRAVVRHALRRLEHKGEVLVLAQSGCYRPVHGAAGEMPDGGPAAESA